MMQPANTWKVTVNDDTSIRYFFYPTEDAASEARRGFAMQGKAAFISRDTSNTR